MQAQNSEIFQEILNIQDDSTFLFHSIQTAQRQFEQNALYHNYLTELKIASTGLNSLQKIPFLPIEFYKSHEVKTGIYTEETIFTSSATTGSIPSKHYVRTLSEYEATFLKAFNHFYGNPKDWVILGLLPSYLERNGSSLVYMVEKLAKMSGHTQSGFYLYDHDSLAKTLIELEHKAQPTLLFGVTFALLDFANAYPLQLKHTVIIETGGMKGRGEELTREEVALILCEAFGNTAIHSEYGMTELFSQAYSKGSGIFHCPPWMKVMVRSSSDPFDISKSGNGILNVVDLANQHTCAFIATQDLGRVYEDGSFEVLGRVDRSDVRGCNLLIL